MSLEEQRISVSAAGSYVNVHNCCRWRHNSLVMSNKDLVLYEDLKNGVGLVKLNN